MLTPVVFIRLAVQVLRSSSSRSSTSERTFALVRSIGRLLVGGIVAGCVTTDIRSATPAWDSARVFVAGREEGILADSSVQDLLTSLNDRAPTVLYMHGCGGIAAHHRTEARYLSKAGYVVVMPDSFARPGRASNCRGGFRDFDQFRQQEIRLALDRLSLVAWTDPNALFLVGQSEGGYAAARFSGADFRAVVITGWGCADSPILLPTSVPVLNSKSSADPVDRRAGSCQQHVQNRPGGSKVIDPKEPQHWFGDRIEMQREVLSFLAANRRTR